MVRPGDSTAHLNLYDDPDNPGYLGRLQRSGNVSSVTAACMMISRSAWNIVNGMDESFRVAYNDVDMCMRLRKEGYRIVFTPFARLYHYEGQTRGFRRLEEGETSREAREAGLFNLRYAGIGWNDPYYNRHFFSGDGHFWERVPDEPERHIRRLLLPYRHAPVYVQKGSAGRYIEQIGACADNVAVSEVPDAGEFLYLTDIDHLDDVQDSDRMAFAIGGLAGFVRGVRLRDRITESSAICDVSEDRFLGDGFHAPESGQVWSAEEEATVYLKLKQADRMLAVQLGHAIPLSALGWQECKLAFMLNDVDAGVQSISQRNNGRTITVRIPSEAVKPGLNRLTIRSKLWSPSMLGGADQRMLGFSLKKITVKA